ncbi:Disease resistance protein [Quillaja saponaria]|uniref:Disease resistance protein n=1 Tax=Quillaja saponaria TaxID=32244 RepID=A0AAD7KX67_QUISA|nr:Disease resistance protein [Quillaja saponaria]
MAVELVGGAILSSFLSTLFDKMASPDVSNFIRGKKLDHKLLERLEITLHSVNAVLNDAEKKQIRDPEVKRWLDRLTDAVYEADDLLDEISTKAKTKKKVRSFISTNFGSYDRELGARLEEIFNKVEFIAKDKDVLRLEKGVGENLSTKTPSTSLVEVSEVYGRDNDKNHIINLLLDDASNDNKISVIPIVGMGGIGKTTLAQLVYNDDKVKLDFNLKAWVCVSEEFDVLKVTKTVIEAITLCNCDIKDLNLLQLDLKNRLMGKKFLLVLDDVWNENYVDWDTLCSPFRYGAQGSKVIVTTRSEKVALIMQTIPAYHLGHLSNQDCWLLFARHALGSNDSELDPSLERIGRGIVKKCQGLPLAAKTLGGLLRSKPNIKDWMIILKSDIWDLPENESKIIPALRLSYHYLPPNLKRCFAYCSIFPKDYEFQKEELILLWMAENFLQSSSKGKRLEEAGDEYFSDLVSRSFFQRSRSNNQWFVMHDLIHDLAKFVAGGFCFMSEDDDVHKLTTRIHHLSYDMLSTVTGFEHFCGAKNLRTFLPLNSMRVTLHLPKKVPDLLLLTFRCLRVFSLSGYEIDVLPSSIGQLIHLRYLDLSSTNIKRLPRSITALYNLQTLKLCRCENLTTLPKDMQDLVNLRYLDISGTHLEEMPTGMSRLKSIQFLSAFIVGDKKGSGIGELGELPNLCLSLSIQKLQHVSNAKDASEARLKEKKDLECLTLSWDLIAGTDNSQLERDIGVLGKLQPHTNLQKLRIGGYGGTRFPDWVGHRSYHCIVSLHIFNCRCCCQLPPLGQLLSLKKLRLESLDGLVIIGREFYKSDSSSRAPFLSLETLEFVGISSWKQWLSYEAKGEVDAFLNLQELKIRECPKLAGDLPTHLPSLTRLKIIGCEQLVYSLPRSSAMDELRIIRSKNVISLQELPLSPRSLTITGHRLLESMFKAMTLSETTRLQHLHVSDCSTAISFPQGCLPISLKTLKITNCRKLEFPILQRQCHMSLESLQIIGSCVSLISFSIDTFPSLKSLYIKQCENFASLSVSKGHLHHLKDMEIHDCPNFLFFPGEGLPAFCLNKLFISNCVKLKSLPKQMHSLLPALSKFYVQRCPEIESFPEGGLPPQLRSLEIRFCKKLFARQIDWNLPSLNYVCVSVENENIKSFPDEGLLPASLSVLYLHDLLSLERLDGKGIQHLASLKTLHICRCLRLKSLTEESLPASLKFLYIKGCPLLEKHCLNKKGKFWAKIAHIPLIFIDGKLIS